MLELLVELFGGAELFKGKVHAVAPVVVGIGRDVDALGPGLGSTQFLTHGQSVLKREYGQHGR